MLAFAIKSRDAEIEPRRIISSVFTEQYHQDQAFKVAHTDTQITQLRPTHRDNVLTQHNYSKTVLPRYGHPSLSISDCAGPFSHSVP
jgi:hypothetical protein